MTNNTTQRRAQASATHGKAPAGTSFSSSPTLVAAHEAAHAVVALRLGFKVTSLEIIPRNVRLKDGSTISVDGTTYIDRASFVCADAIEVLLREMLFTAAPIELEAKAHKEGTLVGCLNDIEFLEASITSLRLKRSHAEDLRSWLWTAAASILAQDEGAAWVAVTLELQERRSLSSARLRRLIRESDARRTARGPSSSDKVGRDGLVGPSHRRCSQCHTTLACRCDKRRRSATVGRRPTPRK